MENNYTLYVFLVTWFSILTVTNLCQYREMQDNINFFQNKIGANWSSTMRVKNKSESNSPQDAQKNYPLVIKTLNQFQFSKKKLIHYSHFHSHLYASSPQNTLRSRAVFINKLQILLTVHPTNNVWTKLPYCFWH